MREVAGRIQSIEGSPDRLGFLLPDLLPRLLAKRGVFRPPEGRVFRRRHVAQITDEIHHFVIAQQHVNRATRLARLALETHEQVQHLARLRAAVEEIAGADQMRIAGLPVRGGVDHARFAQYRNQLGVRAVDVRERDDTPCAFDAGIRGAGEGHEEQQDRRDGDEGSGGLSESTHGAYHRSS
jgi:hypothetical protein